MRFVIFLFAQFNAEALCPPVLDACAYSFQYSKHCHTAQAVAKVIVSGGHHFSLRQCLAHGGAAEGDSGIGVQIARSGMEMIAPSGKF